MKFKTIINLGLLASAMYMASCGNISTTEEPVGIAALAELENQAFKEEVNVLEIRLENYIKNIDVEMESAKAETKDKLTKAKSEAQNMLLKLRSEYANLSDESAEKWMAFQEDVKSLIESSIEELDYAQENDDDNSDS